MPKQILKLMSPLAQRPIYINLPNGYNENQIVPFLSEKLDEVISDAKNSELVAIATNFKNLLNSDSTTLISNETLLPKTAMMQSISKKREEINGKEIELLELNLATNHRGGL